MHPTERWVIQWLHLVLSRHLLCRPLVMMARRGGKSPMAVTSQRDRPNTRNKVIWEISGSSCFLWSWWTQGTESVRKEWETQEMSDMRTIQAGTREVGLLQFLKWIKGEREQNSPLLTPVLRLGEVFHSCGPGKSLTLGRKSKIKPLSS